MLSIKSIMTTDVITVQSDTPIHEALVLLEKHRISGMPVVDDEGHVVGVLSEKDVLKILLDKKLAIKSTVDDYMSRSIICFQEDDSVMEVCKFFARAHMRRVPVLNKEKKLVGVVSRADIIPIILEAKNKFSDFRYI